LGRGIVGGPLLDIAEVSRNATAVALRLLQGEVASRITTSSQRPGPPQFDWRELRRWGIDENRLPPGSVVQFREPTPWQRYRWQVVSVLVGFAEALLILTLVTTQVKRRRAERSLRESEQRFRLLANAAPIMLWMADSDHRCTNVNRAYLDFTGRTLEAEQGHGWTDAIHPDDVKNSLETCVRAFNRRDPIEMEYRLRRHDGEYRWVFITGIPRFTEDGSFVGYIGSSIDITEHKLAKEALSGLSRKLMEAHEGERAVIARDLHDDVGQRLVGLTMQLHSLSHMLSHEAGDARLRIREVCSQAADLERDVQAISHQLHSSSLEHLGLASAAADLCHELSRRHDVGIGFRKEDVPDDLPKEVALNMFRVLQEALSNALRHSGARDIWVKLSGRPEEIELEVTDNGIGFDPEAAIRSHGLGLISMQERLGLVDGAVLFESQIGAGTRVHARVPLKRTGLTGAVLAPSIRTSALRRKGSLGDSETAASRATDMSDFVKNPGLGV